MKQKKNSIFVIVCIILAAVLLLSVIALIRAKSEGSAPEATLDDTSIQTEIITVDPEEYYCTLVIDTWTVQDGILSVSTFVQAVIPEAGDYTAQIELWKDNSVLDSTPITLEPGEADGIQETDVSVEFEIPEIAADEELQLWLTINLGSETIYSCGAGWYLENGQLMLITG